MTASPVSVSGPGGSPNRPKLGREGQPAHAFFLPTAGPTSVRFDLGRYVGERAEEPSPVVLAFAAWSCAPCRRELSAFAGRAGEVESAGARLAAIVMDETAIERSRMIDFLVQEDFPFPIIEDDFQLLARKYGVESLPHVVLIRSDGVIAKVRTGFRGEASVDAWLEDIDQL